MKKDRKRVSVPNSSVNDLDEFIEGLDALSPANLTQGGNAFVSSLCDPEGYIGSFRSDFSH